MTDQPHPDSPVNRPASGDAFKAGGSPSPSSALSRPPQFAWWQQGGLLTLTAVLALVSAAGGIGWVLGYREARTAHQLELAERRADTEKAVAAALAHVKQLLDETGDSKDAQSHFNLGVVFAGKEQWDDAIAEYKRAIELDPKFAKAYMNLGIALAAKNRLDDAIAEYKKAIEIDPKNSDAQDALAEALRNKGR
jgi:superkiller protein 3